MVFVIIQTANFILAAKLTVIHHHHQDLFTENAIYAIHLVIRLKTALKKVSLRKKDVENQSTKTLLWVIPLSMKHLHVVFVWK